MNVPLIGRPEVSMTREEVQTLIDIEPVLKKLHLSLYCKRCHARGMKDGVSAKNHDSDSAWSLECGCSVRTFRRMAEPVA
jgi:hypothetical protein